MQLVGHFLTLYFSIDDRADERIAPFFIMVELLMKYSTATTGTRIKVTATDTVLDLKEAIYEQDGIPSSQQQLFFNGTVLEDIVSLRRQSFRSLTIPSWSDQGFFLRLRY